MSDIRNPLEALAAELYPRGAATVTDACVGFVECPCARCAGTRREANQAHPNHAPGTELAYCAGCQQSGRHGVAS